MWQDALALLIVGVTVLAMLRKLVPAGRWSFSHYPKADRSLTQTTPTGGCSGCMLGACANAKKVSPPMTTLPLAGRPIGLCRDTSVLAAASKK